MLSLEQYRHLQQMAEGKSWPTWLYEIFPLLLIYYRASKPKPRQRKVGTKSTGRYKVVNGRKKEIVHFTYAPLKKAATREQNNYSYCTCLALAPDSLGTIKRIMKHRGFRQLIAAVYATPEEIAKEKDCWRYHFYKYRTTSELFNKRLLDDPRWKKMCDDLEIDYPSRATGQLRLL